MFFPGEEFFAQSAEDAEIKKILNVVNSGLRGVEVGWTMIQMLGIEVGEWLIGRKIFLVAY